MKFMCVYMISHLGWLKTFNYISAKTHLAMWDTSEMSGPLIDINVHFYHWVLIFLTGWCSMLLWGGIFVSASFRCPHVTPSDFH